MPDNQSPDNGLELYPWELCGCDACQAAKAFMAPDRKKTVTAPNGRLFEFAGTVLMPEIQSGNLDMFYDTRELFCDLYPGEEMHMASDGDQRLYPSSHIPIRKSRWKGLRKLLKFGKMDSDER
jgi:hypothetical protein